MRVSAVKRLSYRAHSHYALLLLLITAVHCMICKGVDNSFQHVVHVDLALGKA